MMPSPFPGMDPYLEQPAYWSGFHNRFIGAIERMLNQGLPPGFAANAEERVLVLLSERIREMFIEIRLIAHWDEVVAVIEVLSPTNKAAGSQGREEYLRKQAAILESRTHLMEIDLLLGGAYSVAVPLELLQQQGQWDYLICLHRSTERSQYEYWFNRLQEPLPEVSVPLTEGFSDVRLDLQAAFTQAYEGGPYARRLDYREPPPLPLQQEDEMWVEALLREKGLRP